VQAVEAQGPAGGTDDPHAIAPRPAAQLSIASSISPEWSNRFRASGWAPNTVSNQWPNTNSYSP
jgi:hypothetical protein